MQNQLIFWKDLLDFTQNIFMKMGVAEEGAYVAADNLIVSNLRGIDSHGVARLQRYVDGIKKGYIIPDAQPEIVKANPVFANIDGKNGLGQIMGEFGMREAIKKAKEMSCGIVTVFNSNHYGFAGYYAMMALGHDLMGISLTNSAPLVVPTFGKNAVIGTNPISVAVPTAKRPGWVMDFATSVVPRGKLEVYNRLGKNLPLGWATDEKGHVTEDPANVIRNLADQLGGGILPLGGAEELLGGHKGYGLAAMVDIFCGILSSSNYGPFLVPKKEGKVNFPRIGHLFMAIDPGQFDDLQTFKSRMDDYIDILINSEKAEGKDRIYYHGEKEFEETESRKKDGIPIDAKTEESLRNLSNEYEVPIRFKNKE